jgi:GTP pyrophosphokinase
VGYVSRGRGVSVHRVDCANVKNMMPERLLKAEWANTPDSTFRTALRIESVDKTGMIGQISAAIAAMNFSITSMDARIVKPKEKAVINVGVEIRSLSDVDALINKLSGVDGVLDVRRNQ